VPRRFRHDGHEAGHTWSCSGQGLSIRGITAAVVSSYLAFSPLPLGYPRGGIFSVTLSVIPHFRTEYPRFHGVPCPLEFGLSSPRLPPGRLLDAQSRTICCSVAVVDPLVCQPVRLFVPFAFDVDDLERKEGGAEEELNLLIIFPKGLVFHTVYSVKLTDHQFAVGINHESRTSHTADFLQAGKQRLIFRNIVCRLTDVTTFGMEGVSGLVFQQKTITAFPGISAGGSIRVRGYRHFSSMLVVTI
jgi:hypothetical protein